MADIDTLALSIRAKNCIKRYGIDTVEELQERMDEFEKHAPKFAKEAKTVLETREMAMNIASQYKPGEWVNTDTVSAQLSFEELCSMVGQTVAITATSTGDRCIIVNVQEIRDIGNSRSLIYAYGPDELTGVISESDFRSGKRKAYRLIGSTPELKPSKKENIIVLPESYEKAVSLHRRIVANAHSAQESLLEICKDLKEMRDGKLYKELGYQNFEDYAETEIGMSRHMAYKYIAVTEMKNVESIQQAGVTKLALLAKLDEPQREEIQQTTDIESVSVRELKKQIKELKIKADKADMLSSRLDEMNTNCARISGQRDKAQSMVRRLETQIQELESRPVEVAVKETDSEELEKLRSEYEAKLAEAVKPEAVPDLQKLFEAYYSAARSSMEKLVEFLEENNVGAYIQKTADFLTEFTVKVDYIEWIN